MAAITLTEAFAEIAAIDLHLARKRYFLLVLAVRPGYLRDPLARAGGLAAIAVQQQQEVEALEARWIAMRRAVRAVAQSATITLGAETRSIADWLEWRRKVAYEQRKFLRSLRDQVQVAQQQAHTANYALAASGAPGPSLDIVVNLNEQELARQSELLEEAIGGLEGQLSLKSATLTIEVNPLTPPLMEQDALLTEWQKLLETHAEFVVELNRDRYADEEPFDSLGFEEITTLSPLLQRQVRALLTQSLKIQAIKLVREQTGWSLRQAKNAVEALQ